MRFVIPMLLLATAAIAAPVPVEMKTDRARLEAVWNDLLWYEPADRARAIFTLLDHPKGIAFLEEKLTPVDATADQLKTWLKSLNSDDEKEWKPAVEQLQYHDPRIGLTLAEQVELVDTDDGRIRLLQLWNRSILRHKRERYDRITLTAKGNEVKCEYRFDRDGGSSTKFPLPPLADHSSQAWYRAALAAHVLHHADTKACRAALERLATGHKDALPTKTAAELIKAQPPKPATEFTDADWKHLVTGDLADMVRAVFAIRNAADLPKALKAKLPAITVSRERVTKWLTALNDEDPKVWQPAFADLCYFRPTLVLSLKQQCDLVTTDTGRSLLFQFWWLNYAVAAPVVILRTQTELTATSNGLTFTYAPQVGTQRVVQELAVPELAEQTCPQWQRAQLAVAALERTGSADAKAVLKQMADGHPDILPTKQAKAALARMK